MSQENNNVINSALNLLSSTIQALIQKFRVPGGQLAVMVGNKLYRRNFGWAFNESVPVNDNHIFRVASNSKPLTAIGIMKLLEEHRLSLDDHPYCDPQIAGCDTYCTHAGALAKTIQLPMNLTIASGQCQTTIRNLLEMSAGFCEHPPMPNSPCITLPAVNNLGYEASYRALLLFNLNISNPATPPATTEQLIAVLSTVNPQYEPGTSYNYCNSCFDALSQLIEAITKKPYQEYILSLLRPFGITQPRIGRDFSILPHEVDYYAQPSAPVPSIFPPIAINDTTHMANPAYGGDFAIHSLPGCGGWVMSAIDLVKSAYAMGEPSLPFFKGRDGILSVATLNDMVSRPNISLWNSTSTWFAKGFSVQLYNGSRLIFKDGQLPGTFSLLGNFERSITNNSQIIFGYVANTNLNACDDCTDYLLDLFKFTTATIRYNETYAPPPLPHFIMNNTNKMNVGGSGRFQIPISSLLKNNSPLKSIDNPHTSALSVLGENVLVASISALITGFMLKQRMHKDTVFFVSQACYLAYLSATNKITDYHRNIYTMSELFRAMGLSAQHSLQLSQLIQFVITMATLAPTNVFGLVICVMSIATALLTAQIGNFVAKTLIPQDINSAEPANKKPACSRNKTLPRNTENSVWKNNHVMFRAEQERAVITIATYQRNETMPSRAPS